MLFAGRLFLFLALLVSTAPARSLSVNEVPYPSHYRLDGGQATAGRNVVFAGRDDLDVQVYGSDGETSEPLLPDVGLTYVFDMLKLGEHVIIRANTADDAGFWITDGTPGGTRELFRHPDYEFDQVRVVGSTVYGYAIERSAGSDRRFLFAMDDAGYESTQVDLSAMDPVLCSFSKREFATVVNSDGARYLNRFSNLRSARRINIDNRLFSGDEHLRSTRVGNAKNDCFVSASDSNSVVRISEVDTVTSFEIPSPEPEHSELKLTPLGTQMLAFPSPPRGGAVYRISDTESAIEVFSSQLEPSSSSDQPLTAISISDRFAYLTYNKCPDCSPPPFELVVFDADLKQVLRGGSLLAIHDARSTADDELTTFRNVVASIAQPYAPIRISPARLNWLELLPGTKDEDAFALGRYQSGRSSLFKVDQSPSFGESAGGLWSSPMFDSQGLMIQYGTLGERQYLFVGR